MWFLWVFVGVIIGAGITYFALKFSSSDKSSIIKEQKKEIDRLNKKFNILKRLSG